MSTIKEQFYIFFSQNHFYMVKPFLKYRLLFLGTKTPQMLMILCFMYTYIYISSMVTFYQTLLIGPSDIPF